MSNKELSEELHKPFIREFQKRKVHSPFIYSIWGADIADMQLIGKFNKVISLKKKILQLPMFFKKSWMNLIANQTRYG